MVSFDQVEENLKSNVLNIQKNVARKVYNLTKPKPVYTQDAASQSYEDFVAKENDWRSMIKYNQDKVAQKVVIIKKLEQNLIEEKTNYQRLVGSIEYTERMLRQ